MVTPAAGEVILVTFPFSDLSQSKVRPAVCLADAGRGDWVLCQITSRSYGDPVAIPLADHDFTSGGLLAASVARPGKLFTADGSLIVRFGWGAHPGRVRAGAHRGGCPLAAPRRRVTVRDPWLGGALFAPAGAPRIPLHEPEW